MDFSSSSSSPSSQYKGSAFIANTSKPSWDTPIYESCPQFNPMEHSSRIIAEENNRLASSASPSQSNYASTTEEGGDRPAGESLEREHMFDKVVTPSDVGKLNRLVIPKQHAEKYFPLDSNSSEKGLLLDFEDRSGKSWRFRYSYWNSSQSYVMTKGWSRFVKDKKLDAGDVVSFHRALTGDRFYIDWRRRPDAHPHHHHHHHPPPYHTIQFQQGFPLHRQIHPSSPFLAGPPRPPPPITFHHSNQSGDRRQLMGIVANPNHHRGSVISYNTFRAPASSGYNADYNNNFGVLNPNFLHQGSVVYMRPQNQQMQMMEFAPRTSRELTQTSETEPMVFDSVPVVHGSHASTSKRLRLFGVNMECTAVSNESQGEPSDSSSYPPVSLNPTLLASPNSSEELQLRLHGSGTSTSPIRATDFVDKGKSSMSLDFDL